MGSPIKNPLPAAGVFLFAILACGITPSNTSCVDNDIATEGESVRKQSDLTEARKASAQLRSHLRNVHVAREQIAPLVANNDSEPMVNSLSFCLSVCIPLFFFVFL